ncbi:MAG: HD domain-containing protein [Candidatus Omnitrophota bacterium]
MKTFASSLYQSPQFKIIQNIAKKKKIKIYLVGGFLRDCLLKRECFDYDFAVSRGALDVAKTFARKIKGAFVLLDHERGCGRVAKKQGERLWTFDFADFREKTLRKDLAHRDFTINTLCVDLEELDQKSDMTDILFDYEHGLKDLKQKTIRMVSARSFQDDPLRMIRAFSHRALLDFKIEAKTLRQIKKDKSSIKEVSFERIRDEFFKILSSPRAAQTLKEMDRVGLLEQFIPQIYVMYRVKQGGYHHLDVWAHSLEAVRQLEKLIPEIKNNQDIMGYIQEPLVTGRSRLSLMKLAVLLHDIGKPDARKRRGQRTYFYGHERIGRNIARPIAQRLKLSTKECYALEDMILWHLRPGYLSNFKQPSQRAIFRFLRDAKDEAVSILLLSWADQRATRGPLTSSYDQKHHEKIVKQLIQLYFDKKKEKPLIRLINGHDLIRKLKLKPSPLFAKILSEVEERQAMGKIKTKREALDCARKIAQKAGPS